MREHISTNRGTYHTNIGRKTHVAAVSALKTTAVADHGFLCYWEKPVLSVNQDARSLSLFHIGVKGKGRVVSYNVFFSML